MLDSTSWNPARSGAGAMPAKSLVFALVGYLVWIFCGRRSRITWTRDLYSEPLHPAILIATLLQHLTDLNKNRLPDFEAGSLGFRQHAVILAFLPHIQVKSPVFCGLDRTEPYKTKRAVQPVLWARIASALEPPTSTVWFLGFGFLLLVACVSYISCVFSVSFCCFWGT